MTVLFDFVYFIALLVLWPVLVWRIAIGRKGRHGLGERLGGVPARRGERECLWVHGVSMGEVLQARVLVARFREAFPDWDVVVSTTTDTGYDAARKHFADCTVIRYPLDFSFAVRRSLRRIRPSVVVLIELELWPNFVRIAHARGIPVVIANGRLSETGHRRQKRFRWFMRPLYARVARVAAQTDEYARRFVDAGAPRDRVVVTGSLKYDDAPADVPDVADLCRQLGIADDADVLVAGSTFAGEEEMLLDVYTDLKREFPSLRLVIVPRHPERFGAVADLIRSRGFDLVRRSAGPVPTQGRDAVILGDTMGELVRMYALATVVFVGKSLVQPGGGQNLIEPAALARPVLFGPYVSNFAEPRERLLSAGAAIEVTGIGGLCQAVTQLLSDKSLASRMGGRGREATHAARGAAARTVELLQELLASGTSTG